MREDPAKNGFAVWGVWGGIFTVNLIKRFVQQLCRSILLHFGLGGRVHYSQKPTSLNFGDTKILQNNSRKNEGNLKNQKYKPLKNGKEGDQTILKIRRTSS